MIRCKISKPVAGEMSNFTQINPNAAGIDIGSQEHWVCVPPDRTSQNVRKFGCFTPDLIEMASWLVECGIDTIAMESTGVYWIPAFQIFEARGIEVKLVNAHHVKTVPGRKSDVLDCQWLQQLHTYGLLSGSFRPDDQSCVLRSYIRHRDNLIKSSSSHVLRMQKALIQMNLQLHKVISDITGVTGMAIIRAIVAGERNPQVLANLKNSRIKSSTADIAKALSGDYRVEHIFVLKQELQLYDIYQEQIASCDVEIERYLASFASEENHPPPDPPKRGNRKPRGHEPNFDLRHQLYRISGVDFTQIPGFDVLTVQALLSEVGLDATRFPTVKHFCSWLGLCPSARITGGKVKSSHTRCVVNRAANAFRLAAQSLSRSQSALGAFYRRLRARLGAPEANTATAHKLARIFYHLWSTKTAYADSGADYYEQKYRQRIVSKLEKTAQSLGFELVACASKLD
ncbi:Gp3 protein [Kamptonema sp. PCC 6506]|nr:Gp3 protein [Kamptonema sp. PCC 6506]